MLDFPKTSLAIALVRHPRDPEAKWLAIWNLDAEQYEFVATEKRQDLTFRESLLAELPSALRLDGKRDYIVSAMSRLHLETAIQLPEHRCPTIFSVEFFVVDLYGKASLARINERNNIAWLTNGQLVHGSTDDGDRISPLLVELLRAADLFAAGSV